MSAHTHLRTALALAASFALSGSAAPYFVDLSPVANASREDDGIARNGRGGWTDEGINDMYLYPAVPSGEAESNGHRFRWLSPDANEGRSVVILRVGAHDPRRPASCRVEVPDVKGAFVYFAHQMIGGAKTPAGDEAATYTVHYADGESVAIPLLKGRHLHDWWCRSWWDNSGRDAWPVHMGRNIYTMKWNSLIGIWATQWKNPRPDVAIRGITFASLDRGGPVIWAVTIDDADYHADEAKLKSNAWSNPPAAPEGYFERKLAAERAAVYAAAVAEGHVVGVRSVELVRADLLAVTVDPALTRTAAGPNPAAEAAAQRPETFTVTSAGDAAFAQGVRPTKVGRDSYEYWNGDIGPFVQNVIYWHTFYLQLPQRLKSGCSYEVRVQGIESPLRDRAVLAYDEQKTETPVLKVNQVAYSSRSARRYAYLGWWAGDLGAVDYAGLDRFEAIDERDGKPVLEGKLLDRADAPGGSGELVREMDLAALAPGRYHLRVPGLGRSPSFGVGGAPLRELYVQTQRAFYHQRCGFPLEEPYTRFVKPACHLEVYESGKMAGDANDTPRPGEAKREFRGGYHDAADFDCFTYHLRATAQDLDAFEMAPKAFGDGDLNLPESGNGVPDLLDEADWALRFWREQQTADGAVPKGRCNDQDSRRQNHVQWGPFGIFKPDPVSNLEYAAVAAAFARLIQPYNAGLAGETLTSARKAFDWALGQPDDPKDESRGAFRLWAAGSLFRATGEARFNDVFVEGARDQGFKAHWKMAAWGGMMRWPYVRCEQPGTDAALQARLRNDILTSADFQLQRRIDAEAYRWGGDSKRGLGWGNGNGGGYYADALLRAWWLTGEQKYLDAASLNADFQLGCNPLSKTFITGVGARPPRHPQISAFLYEKPGKRGNTVSGITIYGLTNNEPKGWYPPERPVLRRWRDLGNGSAEVSSEFTITETVGASAMLYATLYSLETKETGQHP